jgi:predicted molibdopterin-dependent oxidoreductase YjgC
MAGSVVVYVDGVPVTVEEGRSLLAACDAASRYVPRLCFHPASGNACLEGPSCRACGLCLIRLGDGSTALACSAQATDGVMVSTDDPELRTLRMEKMAAILSRHPHVCLSCADRDGCARDQCVHGYEVDARCCDQLGRCEFAKVVAFVDPQVRIPRRAVSVPRSAEVDGRIRREPGLCVGCWRCVLICGASTEAGDALEMVDVARPKAGGLRASGCTFCGLCVLVCPTGAIAAPGSAGDTWLASRREKHQLSPQVLPPDERRLRIPEDLTALPSAPGVFTLFDAAGEVLRIAGVADLASGVAYALDEPAAGAATWFRFEGEPLYTQRETELLGQYTRDHGHLPAGNDLGEELFGDDFE